MRTNQPIYDNCFHCSYRQGKTCTYNAFCLYNGQVYTYTESTNFNEIYDRRTRTDSGEQDRNEHASF